MRLNKKAVVIYKRDAAKLSPGLLRSKTAIEDRDVTVIADNTIVVFPGLLLISAFL